MCIINARNKLYLVQELSIGRRDKRRAIVFHCIPTYNILLLYYSRSFDEHKGPKLEIFQPYTGPAESDSLGQESGPAILTSTVCDSWAEKFEKPQRITSLETQVIKIIIATVM